MNTDLVRHNRPVTDRLHPLVYQGLGALALWLVISVWALFDRGPYMALTVVVITGFFLMLAALPFLIWRTWRKAGGSEDSPGRANSFQDWTHGEFQTWTGPLSGREAATQIFLPIAAVSVGMTIFGLVLFFTLPQLGYS
ncbi:MAG TPA: hypothetical protein VHD14_01005 [Pseudolabrys sp.]|nr:hypothetical protein [Pseudolabrys sp.]